MDARFRAAPIVRARLNLAAVATSLRRLQGDADVALGAWGAGRDPLDDRVVENMVAGYSFVDDLVAAGIDVFAMGHLRHLVEMNTLVLCGTLPSRRDAYARHIEATEHRFYDDRAGGVRDLVERHARLRDRAIWDRAAGLYVELLSRPQLFIEGNHRSGALVMSYVLMCGGRPPFVLGPANAAPYFELSAALRDLDKHSPASALRLSGIRQRMASLLSEHSHDCHLIPLGATSGR